MTYSFDFNDPAVIENPYPSYALLRERAPVFHSLDPDLWIVSRYDDVRTVIRDAERFSSAISAIGSDPFNPTMNPPTWLTRSLSGIPAVRVLLTSDPPDHTMLRHKVSRAFTPRRIAAWEPRIREVTAQLVDQMTTVRNPDLVRDLAAPLPAIIIAEMLGVPADRREDFKRWSDGLIDGLLTGGSRTAMIRSAIAISWYFYRAVRRRRRAPGDDMIGSLVTGTGAEALTTAEAVNFCILLLVAGHETTTNLIANTALALFDRPDIRDRLRAEPVAAAAAVTETLRFDGPAQALLRVTTAEVELGGATIPAGAYVLPLVGSANRDPSRFADPDEFRLDRPNTQDHLAFGAGIHYCIGNALARMEAVAAIEEIARRVPFMAPSGTPERIASPVLRGLRSLPITLRAPHTSAR
ncbi:cytochrome P450 [Nocardia macrotermitis]|uniref:Putative cytochrome P450 YjiB n=1 Tax=Nocardia macrotermitis TaxID=2585198 RepID=A0A7K0D594_9NOCA|nr:cytochrome P450 [Nocardia macrotermitis]MQY20913.1 putative cytochrome P450 YjiB [Nocardia macrotermitis]